MSTRPVLDACEHGSTRDGVTDDQPAFAALVDRLGDAYRTDWPPGDLRSTRDYCIRHAATVRRSGVSLVDAGMHATLFLLAKPTLPEHRHR